MDSVIEIEDFKYRDTEFYVLASVNIDCREVTEREGEQNLIARHFCEYISHTVDLERLELDGWPIDIKDLGDMLKEIETEIEKHPQFQEILNQYE